MEILTFPSLTVPGIRHGFSKRSPASLAGLEGELRDSFSAAGFPIFDAVQSEQTHGNQVQAVETSTVPRILGVDALATSTPYLPLVVRVADCGPVYFFDPFLRVIALAHSGRRGTEGNMVKETISFLGKTYGSKPRNLIVQLGPCIRPPHYEIDFAAEIGRQARACGVEAYHDCGICTACYLEHYYSYRAEKGSTGRMWAALMLE